MSPSITGIAVSKNQAEEQQLQGQGFTQINVILNQDWHGNPTYIWFKKQNGVAPITRIQISYREEMSNGLSNAGFNKVDRGLLGPSIFLWYLRGTTSFDTPIQNLEVSTNAVNEAEKMKLGWERVGFNLSGVAENWVYLWMKRAEQTYICDVTATNSFGTDVDLFQAGYVRIDQSTNTIFLQVLPIPTEVLYNTFLWYRQTTDSKEAITDLKLSNNPSEFENQGYTPVSVNLDEGGQKPVYLWYKKQKGEPPVKSMLLLLNGSAIETYEKASVNVIPLNINVGNDEDPRYLCFLK